MAVAIEYAVLDAALSYSSKGWAVLPVAGKVPLTPHGFEDATTDAEVITGMFTNPRTTGVAVACGASGLVVVDLDGEEGREAWANLAARHGGHGRTRVVETGSEGGIHIYFAGEGVSSSRRLGPGVDTRGRGGYVVAPPSLHHSGRRYRWREPCSTLAPVPAWLLSLVAPPPPPPFGEPRKITAGVCPTRYGQVALDGLISEMCATAAGGRNEKLVRLAFRAGRLHASGHIDADVAHRSLLGAALEAGLPRDEAQGAIDRGFHAGSQLPLARTLR